MSAPLGAQLEGSRLMASPDRPRHGAPPTRPREMAGSRRFFDRFAEGAAAVCGQPPFFVTTVVVVVIWGASVTVFRSLDAWQLVMGTYSGVATVLLLALLQNSQRRTERAVNAKLNAIAEAIADLMEHQADRDPDLRRDIEQLRVAVGLEHTS